MHNKKKDQGDLKTTRLTVGMSVFEKGGVATNKQKKK